MHLLHFSLLCLLPRWENCIGFFFINQKMKVNLATSPSLLIFPPSFLLFQGICDERALLMWSCRDLFCCQQHGFLYQMHFDEFAFFVCLFVFALHVVLPQYVCEKYFLYLWHSCVYICVCCRCMACVASSWGCQWNTDDHTCSDMDNMVGPNIIKHRQVGLHITIEWLFYLR